MYSWVKSCSAKAFTKETGWKVGDIRRNRIPNVLAFDSIHGLLSFVIDDLSGAFGMPEPLLSKYFDIEQYLSDQRRDGIIDIWYLTDENVFIVRWN